MFKGDLQMVMKRIILILAISILFLSGFGSYAAQSGSEPSTNSENGPSIFLPVSQWEFEPVVDGSAVVHDFVIQNKGAAPLNISKVKTG
jgi:hypothetical protein